MIHDYRLFFYIFYKFNSEFSTSFPANAQQPSLTDYNASQPRQDYVNKEIWNILASIRSEMSLLDRPDHISGFDKLLQLLLENQCFAHVNTAENVDIRNTMLPLIIRQVVPSVARVTSPRHFIYEQHTNVWIAKGMNMSVEINYVKNDWQCERSKYFISLASTISFTLDPMHWFYICSQILKNQFILQTKPWKCELQLELYPMTVLKNYKGDQISYRYLVNPSLWYKGKKLHGSTKKLPSQIPILYFLIDTNEARDQLINDAWFPKHVTEISVSLSRTSIVNPRFFFVIISVGLLSLTGVQGGISRIEIISFIRNDMSLFYMSMISITWELDFPRMFLGSYEPWNGNLGDNHYTEYFDTLEFCNESSFGRDLQKIFSSLHSRLHCYRQHLLYSAIKNTSRGGFENTILLSLDTQPHLISQKKFRYTIFWSADILSYKFVSCGRPGETSLNFLELVSVFDRTIWLSIIMSIVCIFIWSRTFFPQLYSNMAIWKLYLEQGGAFVVNKKWNLHEIAWRLMVTILLFTGIILSNAYRNTNVYNLIKPRDPLHYETLLQLINSAFQIYSRASLFIISCQIGIPFPSFLDYHPNLCNASLSMQSDVIKIAKLEEETEFPTNTKLRNIYQLVNYTRIHPAVYEVSKNLENTQLHGIYSGESFIKQHFHTKQEHILYQSIEECKNTALVLPQHECIKTIHTLNMKDGHWEKIYLGKELYFESGFGHFFDGMITSTIIRRIGLLDAADLWKRWMSLEIGMLGTLEHENPRPKKPNMRGNIRIIFSIWGVGLLFAAAITLSETIYKLYCCYLLLYYINSMPYYK